MASAKFWFFIGLVAIITANCSAGLLDDLYPKIVTEFYNQAPTEEGYRFSSEEPNGSKREEIGVIMNPGTDKQELVVMGSYSVHDEKTDTDTVTMYTADKEGYKARYQIKNRKLSAGALKSSAG
ncbi:larval cuticle protein 65Ab1-like [Drosophila kikkawai]|uniref:Larval cuticle protein 65Ab1-like n=1 Tax=Drosophila kikkawai TaxID=30033 RepID=A0A6P4JKS6_DROKI|nr:endocuticle structural glycoprotein SgAbd-9-like [Drosophila kikkawai]